ncbi:TetR/AcrR family transcriptional repressor of mexJK operon [Streptosporangium becharense]|uniref:TetR/AcrR family transcriptional repressor of mexJK operon n=1 Tax=Streptosporangium becharense TaxID=1816182 RepID=A0A7W9MJ14_9ACTN|nr:TetR family transcriptional regulator [Streptosporangium becharense]MBB2913120.1 TetR/AcrR family transcriptional repressor of mexJK operon [Streptosporangium becharense]MBB5822103.1 TetR/AcrR family transcriptional repressor of mexJK operon [Streptosporangium becharense]
MTEATQKPVRQGQAHKRAAILAAARELFVQAGVERTSMDAVAARAEVSKRTVYDYYGDKRRLLLGVIEDAGEAALGTLRRLVEQHLSDAVAVIDAAELERVMTDFAADLGSSLLVSSDYAAAVKLIAENEPLLPELEDHPLDEAHTQALAERFEHLASIGLLDVDDPRLAADHFHALTTLRVLNEPLRRRAEAEHVRRIMTDGAHAFMRAYASRSNSRE